MLKIELISEVNHKVASIIIENVARIFVISDTHFGHKNIIEYCNRPFVSTEEMDEKLIKNWNNTVNDNDFVFHLGDYTLCTREQTTSITNQLNGQKYFLKGNHDRYSTSFYTACGLTVIPSLTKMVICDDDKTYNFILSHRPLPNNEIPDGYVNIHGHIHNNSLDDSFDEGRHKNVSVDVIDFKPIDLLEFMK